MSPLSEAQWRGVVWALLGTAVLMPCYFLIDALSHAIIHPKLVAGNPSKQSLSFTRLKKPVWCGLSGFSSLDKSSAVA
jgi:hypothetical protein